MTWRRKRQHADPVAVLRGHRVEALAALTRAQNQFQTSLASQTPLPPVAQVLARVRDGGLVDGDPAARLALAAQMLRHLNHDPQGLYRILVGRYRMGRGQGSHRHLLESVVAALDGVGGDADALEDVLFNACDLHRLPLDDAVGWLARLPAEDMVACLQAGLSATEVREVLETGTVPPSDELDALRALRGYTSR